MSRRPAWLGAVVVLSASLLAQAPPDPPRLMLLLVVDQFRADYREMYGAQWTKGLHRLYSGGAVFTNARHSYAGTWTCAGHATIGTGTLPSTHGMIGNYWFDVAQRAFVPCSDDPAASALSLNGGLARETHSGRAMLAPTFGDELRRQATRPPQILAVSLKPRSAIGLGGHGGPGTMVLWEEDNGTWATSDAYTKTPWPEVAAFLTANPPTRDNGRVWNRLLPIGSYRFDDDAPGETSPLPWGRTFPHPLRSPSGRPDIYFTAAWERSPMSDEYLADLTMAVMAARRMGQAPGIDFVAIGFSALDLVGHEYGPQSHEVQDVLARLDVQIGRLLDALDASVGRNRYVVALSADHGVAPLPEQQAPGVDAGRIPSDVLQTAVQRAVVPVLGIGNHYLGYADGSIYLAPGRAALLRQRPGGLDLVRRALEQVPGIARVFSADDLLGPPPANDPLWRRVRESFFQGRSGDFLIIPKPNWIVRSSGTAHGSPHPYDDRVPLILAGAGVRPGTYPGPAGPVDIAPTLAALARITMGRTDGRALTDALVR